MRSIGTSSQAVSRAMLSASGWPVPFSIRDSVEAETEVLVATSRRLSPSSSRRRRTARPSSSVLTSGLEVRFVRFIPAERITLRVLDARLCFMLETWIRSLVLGALYFDQTCEPGQSTKYQVLSSALLPDACVSAATREVAGFW